MSNDPKPRIVMVDDDPADTYIIRRALTQAAVDVDIELLLDGQAFVDFYSSREERSRTRGHQLVLLDINMPLLNGFDALRAITDMAVPRHTPILMFSTSSEPEDIALAYHLGVNGYVKKPGTIDEAATVAAALDAYWLRTNIVVA